MTRTVVALVLIFCLTGCQSVADLSDKAALRRQCHIPAYAQLITYNGFPWINGFGQREGLTIKGRFQIPPSRIGEFERFIQNDGWAPLPVSAELRARLPWKGKELEDFDAAEGFFRCQAAGTEVLHARKTYPCSEAPLVDMMTLDWEERDGKPSLKLDAQGQPALKLLGRGLNDVILSVYNKRSGTVGALVLAIY